MKTNANNYLLLVDCLERQDLNGALLCFKKCEASDQNIPSTLLYAIRSLSWFFGMIAGHDLGGRISPSAWRSVLPWHAISEIWMAGMKGALEGRRMVLLGAGPSLKDLDDFCSPEFLGDSFVVGVNSTYIKRPLDLMFTSYSSEIYMGLRSGRVGRALQLQKDGFFPVVPGAMFVRGTQFKSDKWTALLDQVPAVISTAGNIFFASLCLAAYFRPSELYVVGFELTGFGHWYHYDSVALAALAKLKAEVLLQDAVQRLHPYDQVLTTVIREGVYDIENMIPNPPVEFASYKTTVKDETLKVGKMMVELMRTRGTTVHFLSASRLVEILT